MRLRLFMDIGHDMTKIDWEEPTKLKHACTLSVGA